MEMIQNILLMFGIAMGIGLIFGTFVRIRFKQSTFAGIHRYITFIVLVLTFSFELFAFIELNLWSLTLIPFISLLMIYIAIRGAIGKLLKVG